MDAKIRAFFAAAIGRGEVTKAQLRNRFAAPLDHDDSAFRCLAY